VHTYYHLTKDEDNQLAGAFADRMDIIVKTLKRALLPIAECAQDVSATELIAEEEQEVSAIPFYLLANQCY
jgi:hypothetical protein